MKFSEISESTTAGSVASVVMPLGNTQKRAGSLFKGKKTKKKFYEGKMKELVYDLKSPPEGLNSEEFKKKYGKSKEEMKKSLSEKTVSEAEINEDDLILVPGQGKKLKPGFIPHDKDRTDHEVEMARSDLFQAAKNAKEIYTMVKEVSEEEGLEGWVQEKIIKANDYLNTVREYLEHKTYMNEGGVLAGGMNNFEEGSEDVITFKSDHYPQKSMEDGNLDRALHNIEKLQKLAKEPKYQKLNGGALKAKLPEFDGIWENIVEPGITSLEWLVNYLRKKNYEKSQIDKVQSVWKNMNNWLYKKDLPIWKQGLDTLQFKTKFEEASDISGLMAASKLNKSFIVTAKTAEGKTKKFRVKAQSAGVAKEVFKKHHSMAEILDVKDEDLLEAKKDACYNKVKSRYKVWPSAYASGALVKCRKVGASNWGNKSK